VDDLSVGFVGTPNNDAYSEANYLLLGYPLGWEYLKM
jgi:hypothetical protein